MPAGASNLLHKTINDYQNVTDFSIIVHEVSKIVRFSRVFWRFFKAPLMPLMISYNPFDHISISRDYFCQLPMTLTLMEISKRWLFMMMYLNFWLIVLQWTRFLRLLGIISTGPLLGFENCGCWFSTLPIETPAFTKNETLKVHFPWNISVQIQCSKKSVGA